MRHRLLNIAVLCSVAAATPAFAHNIWFTPAKDAYLIQFGHEQTEAYRDEQITKLSALDATGKPVTLARERRGEETAVRDASGASVLMIEFDNGIHPRKEAANAPKTGSAAASHALKFGKYVNTWGAQAGKAAGQDLEIVPLSSAPPAAGAKLPVQVLWNGKPLAGAELTRRGDDKSIETDAQGKATVTVVPGLNTLTTVHRAPAKGDPRFDMISLESSFGFTAR